MNLKLALDVHKGAAIENEEIETKVLGNSTDLISPRIIG